MRIDANARLWTWFGLVLFVGMALAVFAEVIPWGMAPLAPDAMPFFPFGNRTVTLDNLLASGGEATPHQLYWMVFHPLVANKLTYVIDTLVLVLAGVYYLRARQVSRFAAWAGGLALGFSGYTFTLFSAGHRGYFHMLSCAVFAFGLLVHCFRDRHWFHFAMLGACLAWGLPYQADVLAMVVFLAGAYTLWLTFSRACDPLTPPWRRIVRVYPRFLLTLAVAALIAMPGLKTVLGQQMAGRKEQLAASMAAAGQGAAQTDRQAQYIFATNWSLPPEDMAEFVVPCLFGVDSLDQKLPYWGRLGRAYDWVPNRREMPNYRQHTVYLGVVQILFALLAILAYAGWRRTKREPPPLAAATEAGGFAVDVPFWVGAAAVCLLLALGRYTPCYHLFYAIPYMDLVRDPVKFHHLVEICTAFLFGLGVEFWLRNRAGGKEQAANRLGGDAVLRRAAVVAGVLALALFLSSMIAGTATETVGAAIARVGFAPLAAPLSQALSGNLLRSAFLAALAAVLLWLGCSRQAMRWPLLLSGVVLMLVFTTDAVLVARRYMRPIDVGPFYRVNPVVQAVLARGGLHAGVANYVTSNDVNRDWLASSLWRNGVRLTVPAPGDTSAEGAVAQALGNRPAVYWAETGTRFVLATWSALEPLIEARILTPVLTVRLDMRAGKAHVAVPAADACLLAEYTEAPYAARVVSAWQGGVDEKGQLAAMRQPAWTPVAGTISAAPSAATEHDAAGRDCGTVRTLVERGGDLRFATILEVDAARAGLLVTAERIAGDRVAFVDGRPASVYCANGLWCSIPVPAGHHLVRLERAWRPWPTLASALGGLFVAGWGLFRLLRRRGSSTI